MNEDDGSIARAVSFRGLVEVVGYLDTTAKLGGRERSPAMIQLRQRWLEASECLAGEHHHKVSVNGPSEAQFSIANVLEDGR
jgi:hypothetical protein